MEIWQRLSNMMFVFFLEELKGDKGQGEKGNEEKRESIESNREYEVHSWVNGRQWSQRSGGKKIMEVEVYGD